MCDEFLTESVDGLPSSAIILTLTDGECLSPDRTREVAAMVKQDPRVTIATALFGTKGQPLEGSALMKQICSDPVRFYKTVYDAETLRKFFTASVTAAAQGSGAISDPEELFL